VASPLNLYRPLALLTIRRPQVLSSLTLKKPSTKSSMKVTAQTALVIRLSKVFHNVLKSHLNGRVSSGRVGDTRSPLRSLQQGTLRGPFFCPFMCIIYERRALAIKSTLMNLLLRRCYGRLLTVEVSCLAIQASPALS
jgi:hypothetical protein